jgi:hypothetical protein
MLVAYIIDRLALPKVDLNCAMHPAVEDDCCMHLVSKYEQYTMVHAAANRMHNDIGCKGRTPFMELPNFN